MSSKIDYESEEAEVRAIWIAVKKARDWKITSLEVESDALFVVQRLQQRNYNGTWRTDALLKDIASWVLAFDFISFAFAPRNCNRVAHELAQWGKQNQTEMYWSTPPFWLLHALGGDMTSVS
ncbi:hypothetical protein BVC80_1699g15 [Macleaya cordata]|uniref:RNase H type-1 domain-containing protein n=1 Tax=Macleaya cordata TaxID=56857 RepID=A0A200PPC4_MACCD|nr:hypothetical protein BVC80_1699g15 [Macleaya cordata]